MHSLLSLTYLLLATVVVAQHVHLDIPAVDAAVDSALTKFSEYLVYHGPNPKVPTSGTSGHPEQVADPAYWLADIAHQGISAFNADKTYQVFRNVKDFGAKGDGVTDDVAAIQAAISSGNRCHPGSCQSSTLTPAIVYFPAGTYMISSSIIDYYFTQLIGNPNYPPTIKALPNFGGGGLGLIDADPYQPSGNQGYGSTNVFYRQIRNLVLDLTSIPASSSAAGIHWPTAQATSLQNVVIYMSQASGTQHVGIFIENGSGGFMSDLYIHGGLIGANFGNQQFTTRNLNIFNSVTAINQLWSWGWAYKSVTIDNCSVGLDMSAGGRTGQTVGSITLFDSAIANTPIGIKTAHDSTSVPKTAGSLILENVQLTNVPIAVQGPNGLTALAGTAGSTIIAAWGEGHRYTPTGPQVFGASITPVSRPAVLLSGSKYYENSKPQYIINAASQFLSVRSAGAKGDGVTDDTAVLQSVITQGALQGKIVFFDAGTYRVANTLYFPGGSKIVGESYPVIMSSGSSFSNINSPIPVIRIGRVGESGSFQWSDMIVSTQGPQAGAVLIEWNLAASQGSGMWDVHTRVGGFTGSNLQVAQCPTIPTTINSACIAAYISLHVTPSATGVYLENVWLWTADHDLDSADSTQISIYSGRGLYFESSAGTAWLYGVAAEHAALYQFQFANTKNVFMGFIQTETPYYQPNPNAPNSPFPAQAPLNDPTFTTCGSGNCDALGLRVINSQNILVYGAGLYSFFHTYNTTCSNQNGPENCQTQIFSVEGASTTNVHVFNLITIGSQSMIVRDGVSLARFADNVNVFPDTIAVFKTN